MAISTAIQTSGATIQFGTVSGSAFTAGNIRIKGSATVDGQLEITSSAAVSISASVLAVTASGTVGITSTKPVQASSTTVIGGTASALPGTSGSLTAGGGMLVKDETSSKNWFIHVHGNRLRLFDGASTELTFTSTGDTIATATNALACSGNAATATLAATAATATNALACSGNAATATLAATAATATNALACSGNSATATLASTVVIGANNASNANYQVLFGSGNGVYSSSLVTMNPALGTITATNINGAGRGGQIAGFSRVYNAVWNDYADYISVDPSTPREPGRVIVYDGRYHVAATEYAQMGALGIVSDTFSFVAGTKVGETQLPLAVSGFVLAYVDKVYPPGTPLTCAPDAGLTEMALETKMKFPERLLATFYREEINATWFGLEVKGRHWVQVR